MAKKADVFWITQRRSVPTAFKLFTGILVLSLKFFICLLWLVVCAIGFGVRYLAVLVHYMMIWF
ncbi:hypothetical protein HanRHA438_Chr17g0808451 [Helianthus annuus]|nr:hypothetical protein HanHA89_Chr17g0702521 [Helianthus annuus]KAJ0812810.1 hypothetical protein HanPSC8_Chr17g0766161 [Helianthus annuus]KAJ0825917.1 hypothetical protein HanRHA438_Chr17g0808451 [Helianthus annuus]